MIRQPPRPYPACLLQPLNRLGVPSAALTTMGVGGLEYKTCQRWSAPVAKESIIECIVRMRLKTKDERQERLGPQGT